MAATVVQSNETLDTDSKELYLYPVDLPFDSLVQRVNKETLVLDPDFQREYKWDDFKASALIESCLMRIPLPVCYLLENEKRQLIVIDGVQRIQSIKRFMENDFALRGLKIFESLNGRKFEALDYTSRRDIENYSIRCIILRKNNNPKIVREIFARLNSGGVLLSAQETRHALNPSPFLDLVSSLALWLKEKGPVLLPMLWSAKNVSTVELSESNEHELGEETVADNDKKFNYHQQAEEFVLRYFALQNLDGFDTLKKQLDDFLAASVKYTETDLVNFENEYKSNFNKCLRLFSPSCFTNLSNSVLRKGLVYYDLQMWGVRNLEEPFIEANKERLLAAYQQLCNDDEFTKTLSGGTARKDSIQKRRNLWDKYFNSVINA